MKRVILILLTLGIIFASCAKTSNDVAFNSFDPKSVVTTYLNYINDGNYSKAFTLADSKVAPVWPGIGLLEKLTNTSVKEKYVEITVEHVSDPVNLGNCPDEVEIVTQLHMKPTQKGKEAFFPVQDRDTFMIFYLIKRKDGFKLSKSFETDSLIANYVETNPDLFKNIKSTIPTKLKRGEDIELVFDLNQPKALGNVGEVSFVLYPEPTTEGYPYTYETVFYSGDDVTTIKIRHFALIKSENSAFPEEHPEIILGPLDIDEEANPGFYRIYLKTSGIMFPIFPYVIEVL